MAEMEMENGQMKNEGEAPSAGEIIANVDTLLGVLADAIMSGPAPEELKKRMAGLQNEFRAIMTSLSQSQGGGAQQGAPQGPQRGGQQANPQPVRSQGTPVGMY